MTEMYKVLVSDSLAEAGLAPLRAVPTIQIDIRTDLSPSQLIEVIPDYDALLVRSGTQVTEAVIQAGKRLRVVARAGAGVDNVDLNAATQAGIIVVNAPTGNSVAAAEHTVAMLMSLTRNIPHADAHVRTGQWKRSQFIGVQVRDKVLGTFGFGRVAQFVVEAAKGLGMKVLAHDPFVTEEYAAQRGVALVDVDTIIEQADFMTFHVPLTPKTRHMIGRDAFQRMKAEARILNVSRGGVVDEAALVDALREGRVAGAALDVFESEPLPADSPLRDCPNLILTPHLGASTIEAQEQVAEDVALQVLDILNDRPARFAVNAPILPPKTLAFMIPYLDLIERMGRFVMQLGAHSVGEVELTAHGTLATHDLAYIRAAAIKGLLADVVQSRVNLVNADLIAEKRGLNLIAHREEEHSARFNDMLSLSVLSCKQQWTVRGAILHGQPHIVAINDLWIDFEASGNLLIALHQDHPGVIGRVGTLLGQSDINISFMHVGRPAPRTEAVMVLGIDETVPSELHAQIVAFDDISWVKSVTL